MLKHAKRIIKSWRADPSHFVVNPVLNGKDKNTGHYVRVLMVKKYNPEILVGYLDGLDKLVNKAGAELRKTIRYAPSNIRFDFRMNNKLQRLNQSLRMTDELNPARKEELLAKKTILALRDGQSDDDRKLLDMQTFLTISAPKKHQLEAAMASLNNWFKQTSGELDQLHNEQLEALKQISPAQDAYTDNSEFFNKHHYGQVTFDSIAARTYPLTRGSFSESEGVYFGRRTEDGSFCFLNLCDPNDPRAQNVAVFGKTGEGKSFFLKALIVSLIDEGIICFVFDLDGEWEDLCKQVGGTYIDQTTEEGRYFEPLTIMPKIKEIDSECVKYNNARYETAMVSGLRTFSLLAEGLDQSEVFEVGEAIRTVYQTAGIDEYDKSTWDNFSGPKPKIHAAFKEIEKRAATEPYAKNVYDRIKVYFIGVYAGIFRTEETFSFDHQVPLVCFRVGKGQVSANEKDERAKQSQIKMSMGFDFVNSCIHMLRIMGTEFSAVLVDEGQRQLKNPELRGYVFDWYTAIRKQNGMMILAGNSPAIMLETSEGEGMFENTNHRVYFYMEQSALRLLSSKVDFPIELQLLIAGNESSNRYVLQYHKRYDELIMHVPEEEAKLYKTRGKKEAA